MRRCGMPEKAGSPPRMLLAGKRFRSPHVTVRSSKRFRAGKRGYGMPARAQGVTTLSDVSAMRKLSAAVLITCTVPLSVIARCSGIFDVSQCSTTV